MIRRYGTEFMGTFFLMLAITFTGNPLAIGLMFMAMIYVGSHVSGGYFNPAVTVAVWLRGKLDAAEAMWYSVAQILGGLVAAGFFYAVSGTPFSLELPANVNLAVVSVPEILLTFVLSIVVLTVATSDLFKEIKYHGLVQGLTLVAIAFVGGLFNPAVALGALIFNSFISGLAMTSITNSLVVHVAAPLLGGVLAAYKFRFMYPKE